MRPESTKMMAAIELIKIVCKSKMKERKSRLLIERINNRKENQRREEKKKLISDSSLETLSKQRGFGTSKRVGWREEKVAGGGREGEKNRLGLGTF